VSRYWLLSRGLHFDHAPCVLDLLAALTIAEHFHVLTAGHVVGSRVTAKAESSTFRQLLPDVIRNSRGCHVQDWVPPAYVAEHCKSAGHGSEVGEVGF
jgi:hypothetical protein